MSEIIYYLRKAKGITNPITNMLASYEERGWKGRFISKAQREWAELKKKQQINNQIKDKQ